MRRGDYLACDEDRRYPPVRRSRASQARSTNALEVGLRPNERRVQRSSDFSDFDEVRSGYYTRRSQASTVRSADALGRGFQLDAQWRRALRDNKGDLPHLATIPDVGFVAAKLDRRSARRPCQPARVGSLGSIDEAQWTAQSYHTRRSANHSRTYGNLDFEEFDFYCFDGDSQIEEYIDWEKKIEGLFEYLRISERKQVKFIVSKLRGRAASWWKHLNYARYLEGRSNVKTWTKMKRLLRAQFLSSDYVNEMEVEKLESNRTLESSIEIKLQAKENFQNSIDKEESDLVDTSTDVIVGEDIIVAREANDVIDKAIEVIDKAVEFTVVVDKSSTCHEKINVVHFREANVDVEKREKACVNIGFVLSKNRSNDQLGGATEQMKGTCSDLPFANECEDIYYSFVEEIKSKMNLIFKAEDLRGEGESISQSLVIKADLTYHKRDLPTVKLDIDDLMDDFAQENFTTFADMKKMWVSSPNSLPLYETQPYKPHVKSYLCIRPLFSKKNISLFWQDEIPKLKAHEKIEWRDIHATISVPVNRLELVKGIGLVAAFHLDTVLEKLRTILDSVGQYRFHMLFLLFANRAKFEDADDIHAALALMYENAVRYAPSTIIEARIEALVGTNMMSRLLHVQHTTSKKAFITVIELLGRVVINVAEMDIHFTLKRMIQLLDHVLNLREATEKMLKEKDGRIRGAGELLMHIRILKMYDWEYIFTERLMKRRLLEVQHLSTRKYLDAWRLSKFLYCLGHYANFGQPSNAQLSLIDPIRHFGCQHSLDCDPNVVIFQDSSFVWSGFDVQGEQSPVLNSITLNLTKGFLIAVIGKLPNQETYTALISCCCRFKLYSEASEFIDSMILLVGTPHLESHRLLISGLCSGGKLLQVLMRYIVKKQLIRGGYNAYLVSALILTPHRPCTRTFQNSRRVLFEVEEI